MKNNRLGCLSPSAIIFSLATMLVVFVSAFFNGGMIFSAGALNDKQGNTAGGVQSHAEIGNDCTRCHPAPWDATTMDELCQRCHKDLPAQRQDPASLHGMLMKANLATCRACHTEHGGAQASLTELPLGTFPHEKMGFALNAHQGLENGRSVGCKDCHIDDLSSFSAATCAECHLQLNEAFTNKHVLVYGESCLDCHDGVETLSKKFDHARSLFRLEGKHAEAGCEECHLKARNLANFKSTSRECVDCHGDKDVHNGQFGQACDQCHKVEGWEAASFDHSSTHFVLEGKHAGTGCADCHNKTAPDKVSTVCSSCHLQDDRHQGSLGLACDDCHTPQGWQPAKFDHNLAIFKLNGKHEGLACEKCHINKVLKGTPVDCFDCHQQDDHHAGAFGRECGICHASTGWTPATFDHKQALFKLTGRHESVACEQCHINGVFKGTPADCIGCHQPDDIHKGQLGSQCYNCHSPAAWKPARFDHNRSVFKLNGAHIYVLCQSCHLNDVYKGTPASCFGCHARDDAHKGALGQQCDACHVTRVWKPAYFNHNLSAFQLSGAHISAACTRCHVNGVYKGTPANCYACHQDDDKHKGGMGPSCEGCHSTSSWAGATFNHNLAAFQLSGAHINAACARCHVNGVYKGTPANCFACHQDDDKHKGGMGPNCAGCHSTSSWAGATFNHNLAAFQLTGAHINAACARCHVNGVYKGTPMSCYSCHTADDKHNGSMGSNCAGCHSTSSWAGATFNHNLAAFQLTGAHINAACTGCHANGVYKGTPMNCYACHAGDDRHNGSMGSNCAGCHSTSSWAGATFNHNLAAFRLTGAHQNLACSSCHANGVFKGTPQACSGCHGEPGYHAGLFSGQSCANCHSTSGWSPASFNGAHGFPMNHGGAGSICSRCHQPTLRQWTCYSCHNQQQIAAKHREEGIGNFSDCLRCHPNGQGGDGGGDGGGGDGGGGDGGGDD